jgi:MFS family permease
MPAAYGSDARRIFAAQAVRAFAYGFGAVLLAATLPEHGWSSRLLGALLTAVLAGTALFSFLVGRFGDRIGRRRCYVFLFADLAIVGAVFAFTTSFWILFAAALAGALSSDVIENGPFTSLEQAMLPEAVPAERRARAFGTYNAIAALAGSAGALCAGGPELLRRALHTHVTDQKAFLVFIPAGVVGALLARSLSSKVEPARRTARAPLVRSRGTVRALSVLFAADSFGGGFVVQAFVGAWFHRYLGATLAQLGVIFFFAGLLQTASFLAAPRLAERFGLLNTMVFTHLPSNALLAAIPFAPNLATGIALLLARQILSQMDVPTRQAYVAALVDPEERTAAAAYTNTARYVTRPLGPLAAGAAQSLTAGAPFVVAGTVKAVYDLVLYTWFRRIPLNEEASER